MRAKVFEYYVNCDERGEFRADVRNEKGKTVYKIEGFGIFEDGFMTHKNDIDGLSHYLKEVGIMAASASLIAGN